MESAHPIPAQGALRRMPVGAEIQPQGGVHFRVWAPRAFSVFVALDEKEKDAQAFDESLTPEGNGYWSGLVAEAGAGTLYRYRLDGGAFPDMASRFQPQGPHGSSQVIGFASFTSMVCALMPRNRFSTHRHSTC